MTIRVGNLLRHHLEDAKMSQVYASQHVGCSAKHLNQILQGRATLSMELAIAFEKLLMKPCLAHELLSLQVAQELEDRGLPVRS